MQAGLRKGRREWEGGVHGSAAGDVLDSGEAERQGTDTGKTDPSVSRLERVQNGSEAKLEHGVHGVPVGKGRESGEIRERDGEMERKKRTTEGSRGAGPRVRSG